jgi:hypothetical protein
VQRPYLESAYSILPLSPLLLLYPRTAGHHGIKSIEWARVDEITAAAARDGDFEWCAGAAICFLCERERAQTRGTPSGATMIRGAGGCQHYIIEGRELHPPRAHTHPREPNDRSRLIAKASQPERERARGVYFWPVIACCTSRVATHAASMT